MVISQHLLIYVSRQWFKVQGRVGEGRHSLPGDAPKWFFLAIVTEHLYTFRAFYSYFVKQFKVKISFLFS